MASDRKVRKFIRRWRRRYLYPVDWMDNRANKQCRRSEAEWLAQFEDAPVLKRREVRALIEWRFAGEVRDQALQGIDGPAAWGHARRQIKKALATRSPTEALDLLLGEQGGIPGWGPAVSSVVLAACRPDIYALADHRVLRTLAALNLYSPRGDREFVRLDWWPYLRACRELARLCELPLRGVAQALWAAADEAPDLPGTPERRRSP